MLKMNTKLSYSKHKVGLTAVNLQGSFARRKMHGTLMVVDAARSMNFLGGTGITGIVFHWEETFVTPFMAAHKFHGWWYSCGKFLTGGNNFDTLGCGRVAAAAVTRTI